MADASHAYLTAQQDDATPAPTVLLRIEQVATRTGLTTRTLRYYEEIGLLPAPERTEGNYRLYTPEDVARLEQILALKEALGVSLKDIREMLAAEAALAELRATYRSQPASEERRAMLDRAEAITRRQLALVTTKMQTLTRLQTELHERLDRYNQRRAELDAQ